MTLLSHLCTELLLGASIGVNRMDIPSHLDLRNPHSFEMKDLEHLIRKVGSAPGGLDAD